MSLRWLRNLALLVPAFTIASHAQSLGEVASETRAEEQQQQQSGVRPRVYTNDDLVSPDTSRTPPKNASPEAAAKDGSSEAASQEPAGSEHAKNGKSKETEKERQARELEMQKRTQEINKQYLDRIAAIREKITNAQNDLARLQRDQVESTMQFQRNVGVLPSIPEYQQQQRLFNEQIEAQRNLIVSLNAQLEDAQESARHAGVPHASD